MTSIGTSDVVTPCRDACKPPGMGGIDIFEL